MIENATELQSFIEYGADAVVSKTLLKNSGGTLTLFAFDKGQVLSEHTAPFAAVVLVVEGTLEVTIGGKQHQLTAGKIIHMPANIPHGLAATTRAKMLLMMFKDNPT